MAVITITNQKYGGSGNFMSSKNTSYVIDLGLAASRPGEGNTYATGDTLLVEVVDLPAGLRIEDFDAEILEALPASSTTDIGTTTADPDEYIDASATVAKGRFGAYVSVTYPEQLAAAKTLYVKVANASAITKGKISLKLSATPPLAAIPGRATYREYPNS